jgi:hypothetical protein
VDKPRGRIVKKNIPQVQDKQVEEKKQCEAAKCQHLRAA